MVLNIISNTIFYIVWSNDHNLTWCSYWCHKYRKYWDYFMFQKGVNLHLVKII